jgi:phosphoribosylanthranilate isomerase
MIARPGAETGERRTRIKICGLCRAADCVLAARAGADYLGFVFAKSPRQAPAGLGAELEQALGYSGPERVGVFVLPDPPLPAALSKRTAAEIATAADAFRLDLLQLHGPLSPALARALRAATPLSWILAVRAGRDDPEPALAADPFALLFDTPHPAGQGGGSGQAFDWSVATPWRERARLFLAGGLGPTNVAQAVAHVRPFAVDVASGVETAPGEKSEDAIRAFVAAVRAADRGLAVETETG